MIQARTVADDSAVGTFLGPLINFDGYRPTCEGNVSRLQEAILHEIIRIANTI